MIRSSHAADHSALDALYPRAFPDEDLRPLIGDLLDGTQPVHSLVWMEADEVIGHAAFSLCSAEKGAASIALLGPLAVDPRHQMRGIGSALVRHGMEMLAAQGVVAMLVLGSPAFYGRFGFASGHDLSAPFPLKREWLSAWQAMPLQCGTPLPCGPVAYPRPWINPALWH